MDELVFADANGSTPMPPQVIDAWVAASNRGDPLDGSFAVAEETQKLLARFRKQIERESGLDADDFRFVFTSGVAEANILMLDSCVNALRAAGHNTPHVIIGAAEADSIRNYAEQLSAQRRCRLSYAIIDPETGTPTPETIRALVRSDTCLITVAAANPLTGALTNLPEIAKVCFTDTFATFRGAENKKRRIPLHTDASALFARSLLYPNELNVDAYSVSFHLMHGPPGFGFLALRNSLAEDYHLQSLISGRPLNLPALAASRVAHQYTLEDRSKKNADLAYNISGIERALRGLEDTFVCFDYPEAPPPYLEKCAEAAKSKQSQSAADALVPTDLPTPEKPEVIFLCPAPVKRRLPNTLLFAIRESSGRSAVDLQKVLEEEHKVLCRGYRKGNRQLLALRVPSVLHANVIRISLPDGISKKAAQAVVRALVHAVKAPPLTARALRAPP